MPETLKCGTIITRPEQLEVSTRTMLLKFKVQEDQTMLELTVQMVNGTKFGNMLETNSRTSKTANVSMLKEEVIPKVKLFGLGNHIKVPTNNGLFSILKIRSKTRLRKTEDSE
jgi:hypothetical protein